MPPIAANSSPWIPYLLFPRSTPLSIKKSASACYISLAPNRMPLPWLPTGVPSAPQTYVATVEGGPNAVTINVTVTGKSNGTTSMGTL
ncbi:hypothetical protein CJ030_MR0G006022 [Morella rubra]|uniref:Uncharacterized protein n=1 Tax=Morella rubra TaxID=262757 RepID=A0A6A1UKV5_9ROSI|nr:hypothetical protein CJ030_MR0G006022 [Morella rubra]